MLERNFERITIALVAILFFLGGCATWQETARISLTISEQAAKAAEASAVAHYETKCPPLAGEDLEKCMKEMDIVKITFTSFYQVVKLGLIAITLGDKQATMEYVQKSIEMVKHIYKILKTILPDKIPDLPIPEPTQ